LGKPTSGKIYQRTIPVAITAATGWWYTYPSEKYDFVSWDDEIPNIWNNHPNVPNHQPVTNIPLPEG